MALLLIGVAVLFGGAVAIAAAAASHGPVAAQPAPSPPTPPPSSSPPSTTSRPELPIPIPTAPTTSKTCHPESLEFECRNKPTATTTRPPCTGEGCIPQPPPASTPPGGPGGGQPGGGGNGDEECSLWDPITWPGCLMNVINGFFRGIVTAALNPLLDLLGHTLLTTPSPESVPRIAELWNNSWDILLISYGLLILIGGVIIMSYQTLQTRHSVKEIAPRLVVGFLAGALSLWVATKAVQIANALSQAVMGEGLDPSSAGKALRDLVLNSLTGGVWILFLGVFLAGMLVVLLVTYIVRVAITILLIAGAPLALMAHALPQTEGIAHWWWKVIGGCLAIQIGQSLTLIAAMRTFLTPGGFTIFGPTVSGLMNLLVAMALMYILFKIPFWFLGSLRNGRGRSLVGSLVRGFLAYKTLGLLRGGTTAGGGGWRAGSRGSRGGSRGGRRGRRGRGGSDDAEELAADGLPAFSFERARRYRRPGTTSRPQPGGSGRTKPAGPRPTVGRNGQYELPLEVERVIPPPPFVPEEAKPSRPARRGTQLELPFDPYQGNRATRTGQYPLPLDGVQRVSPRPASAPVVPPTVPRPVAKPRTRARQPELPFDPYQGNRATRTGQYPLPLDGVQRVSPRPASTPVVPPPMSRPPRPRVRQPELPFDPYQGNRATRTGQYPLPLDDVHRETPTPAPTPEPEPKPKPPVGKQLRLPVDLPKPTRGTRSTPRAKPGGKKS